MSDHIFASAVNELHAKCPMLLAVLNACIGDKIGKESKVATVGTIYAMIMHSRNKQVSAVQRLYTSLAIQFHADNKLLERLNKVHITLSDESKRHVMNNFAAYSSEQIIKECSEGRNCKINGDNVDIYLRTNDVRMDNKNKDLHFFASDVTYDRVSVDNLDDSAPIINLDLVNYKMFLASKEELKLYKESLKILLARLLVEHMKAFEWMKPVVPSHIPHDLEDVMSKKSSIHWLPIQLKNEMHHDQCVEIMHQFERQINNIYCKAGRAGELEDLYVPVGGDQLTRVNLQSAKNLRAGCHTQEERLDHLNPVIVELFHTVMDFLEAHEDFILITGLAYFLVFAMKVFSMKDLDDTPKHRLLKDNMKYLQTKAKEKIFHDIMDEIVSQCWMPFEEDTSKSPKTVNLQVISGVETTNLETTVTDGLVQLSIKIEGVTYKVSMPFENTKGGCRLDIKTTKGTTSVMVKNIEKLKDVDDLNSYACNFMQWYLLLLNFQDTIKEGDIFRTNVILKILIPFFYSHSCLSKYFTECIDYILKTEVMLSPRLSMRVRAASFVNPKGGKGHNKAADMQKENQVKVLKDLIRGLGSNKNENAIVTVSKAAPVINSITKNFDNMLEIKDKGTRHRKREIKGDLSLLLNCLTKLNPWTECPGRQLQGFPQISKSPFNFKRDLLKIHIMDTVNRLKRGAPDLGEISSDSEDELFSAV